MYISEHSPTRLTLRQQNRLMAITLTLFIAFSLVFLVNMLLQGPRYFSSMNAFQFLSYLLWIGLAAGLIYLGGSAVRLAAQGNTCTFDKSLETVTITRPRLLRPRIDEYSIYGVSHIDLEHNAELRACALFMVMRSGARIALASVPAHDQDAAHQISQQIRHFLRHSP